MDRRNYNTGQPDRPEQESQFPGPEEPRLIPPAGSCPSKDKLFQTEASLPADQFELLCIAAAEGDLDETQMEELEGWLINDNEKAAIYNLYRKLRLSPPDIRYKAGKRLKKRSTAVFILRHGIIAISAAASLALLVIAYRYFTNVTVQPGYATPVVAEATTTASDSPGSELIKIAETVPDKGTVAVSGTDLHITMIPATDNPSTPLPGDKNTLPPLSAGSPAEGPAPVPSERLLFPDINPVKTAPVMIRLVEIHIPVPLMTAGRYDFVPAHESLTIKDKLVLAFREKILGKERPDISPVKSWELAAAGITGINRLLDWEMVMEVSGEEYGDAATLDFSSRLLKFRIPLKKTSGEL